MDIDLNYYQTVVDTQHSEEVLKTELQDLINEVKAVKSNSSERSVHARVRHLGLSVNGDEDDHKFGVDLLDDQGVTIKEIASFDEISDAQAFLNLFI